MYGKLNDWKNGWFGIELSLNSVEIEQLIDALKMLQTDSDQHFHISSDYVGSGGIGDIEISVSQSDSVNNLHIGSEALGPGTDVDI